MSGLNAGAQYAANLGNASTYQLTQERMRLADAAPVANPGVKPTRKQFKRMSRLQGYDSQLEQEQLRRDAFALLGFTLKENYEGQSIKKRNQQRKLLDSGAITIPSIF